MTDMELMNGSAVNVTPLEASTTTSASVFFQSSMLEIFLLSCHFMFGLPTHAYVLWLIVKGTGSGVASELFILNLSVSEILFCMDSLFSILGRTVIFQFFSSLAVFLQGLGMTGHPLFQSLMCVERYLAVVHPVTFLKYKPVRYRVICCSVAWIITLGSCLLCLLSSNQVYVWFNSIHLLFVFFSELFCCLAVLRALKQSGPGERKKEREKENHTKTRAFYLILLTTLNNIVMYLPCTIIGLIKVLTQQNIPALIYISFICFTLAGFVQPVLYLHRTRKLFCLSQSNRDRLFPFRSCFNWIRQLKIRL